MTQAGAETRIARSLGAVAQLGERYNGIVEVVFHGGNRGSNPLGDAINSIGPSQVDGSFWINGEAPPGWRAKIEDLAEGKRQPSVQVGCTVAP